MTAATAMAAVLLAGPVVCFAAMCAVAIARIRRDARRAETRGDEGEPAGRVDQRKTTADLPV